MTDIMTYIHHPISDDPHKLDRLIELDGWSEIQAGSLAIEQGISLTQDHWEVVEYLQNYYLDHGWPDSAREMARILDEQFADKGGKRFLYRLFPKAPLKQATTIAGLPPLKENGSEAHGYEL